MLIEEIITKAKGVDTQIYDNKNLGRPFIDYKSSDFNLFMRKQMLFVEACDLAGVKQEICDSYRIWSSEIETEYEEWLVSEVKRLRALQNKDIVV